MQTPQSNVNIDELQLPEIDHLRSTYRIPVRTLCVKAEIDATTYHRGMKLARGESDGSRLRRTTLKALRSALRTEIHEIQSHLAEIDKACS